MDALLASAASGIRARMESLEMLANNLANQASPGFKSDREFYSLYVASEAEDGTDPGTRPQPPVLPVIERHWTDFAQGALTHTSNELDFALDGRGFFEVQGPTGTLYTRNGNFRLSRTNELITGDGYPVLDSESKAIRLDPGAEVEVSGAGEIRQRGQTVARFQLADFGEPGALERRAGVFFADAQSAAVRKTAAAKVIQGKLETSNQGPAEGAVRLISVMRQFESLQRAIQIGSEMNRRVDDVARIGA
ncbi:MAG: flagellar hook basal-body protein [Bryobacteraceae bacterium]